MKNPSRSQGKGSSCDNAGLLKLLREAKDELDKAYSLPPREIGKEVDFAEVRIARLRDCLIERVRREENAAEASRWRSALERVNIALSFVVGVEYPATGIHRNLLKEAQDVLGGLAGQMKEVI